MRRNKGKRSRDDRQEIIDERVAILFDAAGRAARGEETGEKDAALASRRVFVARKVSMRIRKPLDTARTRQICKKCNAFLVPGHDARVRITGRKGNARVSVTCLRCGAVKRHQFKRRRQPPRGAREP